MVRIWGTVSEGDAERIDRAAEPVGMTRAKFVAFAVLEQVERFERVGAAPAPDQEGGWGENPRARVQERDVQVARLEVERDGLRDRVALVEGFLHAEMAKSEKILALMPAKKEGVFTRLFRRGD